MARFVIDNPNRQSSQAVEAHSMSALGEIVVFHTVEAEVVAVVALCPGLVINKVTE